MAEGSLAQSPTPSSMDVGHRVVNKFFSDDENRNIVADKAYVYDGAKVIYERILGIGGSLPDGQGRKEQLRQRGTHLHGTPSSGDAHLCGGDRQRTRSQRVVAIEKEEAKAKAVEDALVKMMENVEQQFLMFDSRIREPEPDSKNSGID